MEQTVLFDRYTLLEPAGVGGSAEVWRARDETTGEIVAVKRLHPVVFGDEAGKRRLQREFDALRSLDEPHIVRVRDLQIGEREAALVLDFVDGESLAQRLAGQTPTKPAVSAEAAAAIVADVAAALAAAHAAGIVHRDVTPGNILLTGDGEARLTDFGIAHASGDATAVTATGLLMGTMRYLAPEQLRGGTSTPASDLHGLAAVTYEMLAGHPAYDATSPVALADAQAAGPAPIAGLPAALDGAVRRGLALDPADRPADVRAFAASIEAALGDQETMAIPMDAQPDRTAAIPLVAAAAAAGALHADDVGVAVPSRAAARHGPVPRGFDPEDADIRADPEPVRAPVADRAGGSKRGRRVPAPVALALGLVVVVAALAAASGADRPFGTGDTAADASAVPSATPKPTARPSPTPVPQSNPGKGDDGKGKGKGNGSGNDG